MLHATGMASIAGVNGVNLSTAFYQWLLALEAARVSG
jgi:hypothetical protein